MKATTLDEKSIRDIGPAFGYYDYEEETGMSAAFSGKEATANYICAYVRGVLRGGFLHTTSEQGEGYIAYKLPGQKLGFEASMELVKALFHSMSLKEIFRMGVAISKGGTSLEDRMKKAKKDCAGCRKCSDSPASSSAWSVSWRHSRDWAICVR